MSSTLTATTPTRRSFFARFGVAILASLGLAVTLYLIADTGFAEVGEAFARAGWGIALILLYDVTGLAFAGLAWWMLLHPFWKGPPTLFIYLRYLREAINNMLPVAQVGGDLIGARLLTQHGPPASLSLAGVLADKTVETLGQFLFTIAGFAVFLSRSGDEGLGDALGLGLFIMAPLLFAFVAVQNSRLFAAFERMLLKLAGRMQWEGLGRIEGMHQALISLYRQPAGLCGAFFFHMLAWLAGAGQVWIALHLMGFPISLRDAFIIESLGQAARSAAFLIPGGLGAQEGAFLLLGAAIGLPADYALALSLVKRTSQLLFGVPLLVSWPFFKAKSAAVAT
jgi:putative membrane protein